MVVPSNYVRHRLNRIWPKLRHIWLRNKLYVLPTRQELEAVLDLHPIDLPIIRGFNECENFALFLHARVKEHRVHQDPEEQYNWAFGDFLCVKKTLLGNQPHTACICLTTDGVFVIEPMQENRIVEADPDTYRTFFVNLN